jgi:hypothetical protein
MIFYIWLALFTNCYKVYHHTAEAVVDNDQILFVVRQDGHLKTKIFDCQIGHPVKAN